jgi:hypothetical protein
VIVASGAPSPIVRADMTDGQWMTYTEAGVRLGINAEAVRRRADRGKWARMPGNDGRTRVLVPEDVRPGRDALACGSSCGRH